MTVRLSDEASTINKFKLYAPVALLTAGLWRASSARADDPRLEAEVRPHRGSAPAERYRRFLDLMRFMEGIWNSLEASKRMHYDRVQGRLDDPGRWWERVPTP